jgi:cell division protein FtsW (lipid II flippase)
MALFVFAQELFGYALILVMLLIMPAFFANARGSIAFRPAMVGLVAFAAFFLRGVRLHQKGLYGGAEVVMALAGTWFALRPSTPPFTMGLAMVAASYVMIRGLDNFRQGLPALRMKLRHIVNTSHGLDCVDCPCLSNPGWRRYMSDMADAPAPRGAAKA